MRNYKGEILKVLKLYGKRGMPKKLIEKKLKISRKDYQIFNENIKYLEKQGIIIADDDYYRVAKKPKNNSKAVLATVSRLAGTFGFVKLVEEDKEVFIPGKYLKGAMPGDKVEVVLNKSQEGLDDGKVVSIVEEGSAPILGTAKEVEGTWYLEADKGFRNPIYLGRHKPRGVNSGDRVLGKIRQRGYSHDDHKLEITTSFGTDERAANCVEGILESQNIPRVFPEDVIAQANAISEAGIHPKEVDMRVDLRDQKIFTIDSAYSKDMDDAISIEKTNSGYKLGVHIADVSYYVTANSPLDVESIKRGTSIYYADKVIPMLPQALSNELCSLNPNVDRLTLSAIMELSEVGELVSYTFERTIIKSRVKGVYSEINEILENTASDEIMTKYGELLPDIKLMHELANILSKNRKEGGSLELESVESRVSLNEAGEAVDVTTRTTGISEGIIEEFMLCANKAAAGFSIKKAIPFIFRIHEKPSPQKLENLSEILRSVGISAEGIEVGVSQRRLSKVLDESKKTPYAQVVNDSLLRSMSKAKYSPENIGHYGLGFKDYSHFTSPIRRYPDLVIHRIITAVLIGMRSDNIEKRFRKFVSEASQSSTNAEIRAMQVERECENCYKAEYMSRFIGTEFEGVVSGVTGHGLYVQLPNTVEGLVPMRDLSDHYEFDGNMRYTPIANGTPITIGTACKVLLTKTSVPTGRIDFELLEVK